MPTKRKEDRYEPDPVDGLPCELVGSWVKDKHTRLRHYVDISRAARRKFDGNTSFIDLYCGPGRAKINDTTEYLPGSTVAAALEAQRNTPFGSIHFGDLDADNMQACESRLARENLGPRHSYTGPAVETAAKVVAGLSKSGLHFAFLDPYNIKSMPFEVIQTLASKPRMDLLIHLSSMDLTRNIKQYMRSGTLENFAPGWRSHVDPHARNNLALIGLVNYWCGLIRGLGYEDVSTGLELVSGNRRQPLYWLALASRNPLGTRFWGEVSNVTPQNRLPF
ncbi:three-Cys-motif partner protein TcmP [Luteimonas sp. XNQY3]|nr:three-Cys-motif partner protein TcmP [Luteimonas sp. XNQY3]MCD9008005.1 three-Cys-motif partner protein TcmP [Luteimonas sp. XNQY3]